MSKSVKVGVMLYVQFYISLFLIYLHYRHLLGLVCIFLLYFQCLFNSPSYDSSMLYLTNSLLLGISVISNRPFAMYVFMSDSSLAGMFSHFLFCPVVLWDTASPTKPIYPIHLKTSQFMATSYTVATFKGNDFCLNDLMRFSYSRHQH